MCCASEIHGFLRAERNHFPSCKVASRWQSQHSHQPSWDTPQCSCCHPTLSCRAQGSHTHVNTHTPIKTGLIPGPFTPGHPPPPVGGSLGRRAQQSASPSTSPGCDCAMWQPLGEPSPGQASRQGSARAVGWSHISHFEAPTLIYLACSKKEGT